MLYKPRRTLDGIAPDAIGGRLLIAMILGAGVLILWQWGLSEAWTAKAILASLRAVGFPQAQLVRPTLLVVGNQAYQVDFVCTPSVLLLCGVALLWFARQRPWAYLRTCLGFTLLSVALILASDVVTVWLHQRGVEFVWAHFPVQIVVYSASLTGCFLFAEVRQRRLARLEDDQQPHGAAQRGEGRS